MKLKEYEFLRQIDKDSNFEYAPSTSYFIFINLFSYIESHVPHYKKCTNTILFLLGLSALIYVSA